MKVAFIGLGDIGEPMASHLARDPFDLVVWNRTASKANDFAGKYRARVATTPAMAVRDAEVVLTCTAEGQRHLEQLAGGRTPVRLVYHGVDIDRDARRPVGPTEPPVVLTVG